jgi:hypothetical protein
LTVILFRPAKKFILVQRIRKSERKDKRKLSEDEISGLEKKTIPMTVFIVLSFALIFNRILMGRYFL